jgi:hypothetical protein
MQVLRVSVLQGGQRTGNSSKHIGLGARYNDSSCIYLDTGSVELHVDKHFLGEEGK